MRASARRKKSETTRTARPAPAPGALRIVQAFVNTEDLKAGTDALSSPRELSEWLKRWGLLGGEVEITAADLERAHAIRSGVRTLVAAHWGGELDERTVERLNQAIRGARPQVSFGRDGSTRFESEDLDGAFGHLVALVVATRIGGLWDRLKLCANSDCRRRPGSSTTKVCRGSHGPRLGARRARCVIDRGGVVLDSVRRAL